MASKYKILLVVFLVVVLLDQWSKYRAVADLTEVFEHHGLTTLPERVSGFYGLKNLDADPYEPGVRDFRRAPVTVIPGFWQHKYVENPGAAWGLLSRSNSAFRIPFFHVVSLLALGFIGFFFWRLQPGQRLASAALAFVAAGAMGNYVDRLARNYVVDFVDWYWGGQHWPTFNVADAAICAGVGLLLLDGFRAGREDKTALVAAEGPPAAVPTESQKQA